jgi:uncharacterized protein VirK/YbjX
MEDHLRIDELGSDQAVFPFPTSPKSALKAGWAAWVLADETYREESCLRRLKLKIKWALAAGFRPGTALTWFETMKSPLMVRFFRTRPLLGFKPLRVYLSTQWSANRRAKVILDSYRFAAGQGGATKRALLDPMGVKLAEVALKGLGKAEVHLGTDERFRKEGELVLSLSCEALGGQIAALSFALERGSTGSWTVLIGCVQGGGSNQLEAVRSMTKAMHGLRPKALMVFLAQETARALGASKLLGAGSGIQAHLRKHAIHLPWVHGLTFSYNCLWTESGGRPDRDGWFQLPLQAHKRSPEQIKPSKKAMYARRYELLESLSDQVQSAFGK